MTERPVRAQDLEDLRSRVQEALVRFEPFRLAQRPLDVRVRADGSVHIRGPVRSRLIKQGILAILQEVPGVSAVVDGMVADPDLEVAVAQRLASDQRTRRVSPGSLVLRSRYGVVTLIGRLPEGASRQDVIEVVRSVEGVRAILDRMT